MKRKKAVSEVMLYVVIGIIIMVILGLVLISLMLKIGGEDNNNIKVRVGGEKGDILNNGAGHIAMILLFLFLVRNISHGFNNIKHESERIESSCHERHCRGH